MTLHEVAVKRRVPAVGGGACRRLAATANELPQPFGAFNAILVSRGLLLTIPSLPCLPEMVSVFVPYYLRFSLLLAEVKTRNASHALSVGLSGDGSAKGMISSARNMLCR
jgi:hypothetical protein